VSPLCASWLLLNCSFETPVTPADGNNFYTMISDWTVVDVTPAHGQPFNILRAIAGYANNPTVTSTGGSLQHVDVNAASGSLGQTITIPSNGMIDIMRLFFGARLCPGTDRAEHQYPHDRWRAGRHHKHEFHCNWSRRSMEAGSIGEHSARSGHRYLRSRFAQFRQLRSRSYHVQTGGGFDQAQRALFGPAERHDRPQAGPGRHFCEYTIVADIGSAGNGRADFAAGSSGLTYSFGSLASATDHIGFSNNNGADAVVTNICFCLQGTMAASAAVTLRLRYRIK
jgi:hypothetical protein